MPSELTCQETKDNGEPCGAPASFVNPETGVCWTHSEEGREKAREAASRGGKATARRLQGKALHPDDLPDVAGADSPRRAAMQAIQTIVYAIGDGSLGHKPGKVMIRGIKEIVELDELDTLDDLMDAVDKWRETDDPTPVLELVKGGRA